MIFQRNMLIEIGNNKIIKTELSFLKKRLKEGEDMINKNLYLMIYDEEVYIKKFNLPKEKGESLYNLVRNELSFSMGNINNILFDYKITRYMNSSVEVIVFYINSHKIEFIKENKCYKNIEKIMLIQFVMKKYYKKSIKEDNYVMAFSYDKNLYILVVNEKNLVANSISENFYGEEEKLIKTLEILKSKYLEQFVKIKNIYLVNIDIELDKVKESLFNYMVVKALEKYKNEKLIGNFK